MNELEHPSFSSLRGSRPRPAASPDSRSYGRTGGAYTPLRTNLDPRTPCRNDVEPLEGERLAVVLQNGSVAVIDKREYEHLRAMGYLGRWTAKPVTGGNTYAAVNLGCRILIVARLVLAANDNESVRYLDGNTMNLVRDNLVLCTRGGVPIRNPELRRCMPAPCISAEDRRKVLRRKVGRTPNAIAAEAATKAAIGKASPSIAAAQATRGLSRNPEPARFTSGEWFRRLIAKPLAATCTPAGEA